MILHVKYRPLIFSGALNFRKLDESFEKDTYFAYRNMIHICKKNVKANVTKVTHNRFCCYFSSVT